jgi:transmembrane serine protease 11D
MTRRFLSALAGACVATAVPGFALAQEESEVNTLANTELSEQQRETIIVNPLIVGGTPVDELSRAPWQVALVGNGTRNQFCGGSKIGDSWVLTAAHCVDNFFVGMDPSRLDVVLGTLTYPSGGEQIAVRAIHTHPRWDDVNLDFDAALLELESPATMGEAVAVHGAGESLPEGIPVLVTGWGAVSEGGPGSTTLLEVEVPVVSTAVCSQPESYDGAITEAMFCAGEREGGKDACQGDSGGPVELDLNGVRTLVGIVSWGHGCARRLKYGVYSRVSKVPDWVNETTGMKN